MARIRHPDRTGLHIRVVLAGDAVMGPGRAELLEHVRDTGSISAAGRAMNMSFKRAWELADALNRCFARPLITASRGGSSGGGARLTEDGARVLALYQAIETTATDAGADAIASLAALVRSPLQHGPDRGEADAGDAEQTGSGQVLPEKQQT